MQLTLLNDRLRQCGLLPMRGALVAFVVAMPFVLACGDDDDDGGVEGAGEVNVLGLWGAEELDSLDAMVKGYEDAGGTVNFTGTRDITAQLTLQVEGGNPPDVAIPAEVGLFTQFARDGQLISLDQCDGLEALVRDKYPPGFIDLGTVDGTLYGFFVKADTKGTVWYNPKVFEAHDVEPLDADATFDDLVALSEELKNAGIPPWSIGVESEAASGWPGSDWLQQIILNGPDGEEVYDGLIDGSIAFTDPRVVAAWEAFGEIALGDGMTVQGGATGINATGFQDSAFPPFRDPPEAAMVYLGGFAGGFIKDQFPDAVPGDDYDFFVFPGGRITGGANIVYAFNDDPATCAFMTYLAGAEAQQVWVERGGFTSVNSDVSLDAYSDEIARKQAEQLLDAEVFRFDLDDAIGGSLQSAIFQGVTEYLDNPDNLESILANIEAARAP